MPVLDLAQMIGLERRRFYDLLDGQEPDRDNIGVIAAVTDVAADVADLVGDRKKAASALLAPVCDGRSFFEITIADQANEVEIRQAGRVLISILSTGAVLGERPAPSVAPREESERISGAHTGMTGGLSTDASARRRREKLDELTRLSEELEGD